MNCPTCGRNLPRGQSRCAACAPALPVEGALAPDPSRVAPPLRELPGRKRVERTWKDEVRDRVKERRRTRAARIEKPAQVELPLFADAAPTDVAATDAAPQAPPAAVDPAAPAPARNTTDDMLMRLDADLPMAEAAAAPPSAPADVDLLLRHDTPEGPLAEVTPAVEPPAPVRQPRPARPRPVPRPATSPNRLLDLAPEPEERAKEKEPSWSLGNDADAASGNASEPDWARPIERVQAALIDLAILGGMWAVVVYFSSRVAHVPVQGLLTAWPWLAAFVAFLGLAYAAFFTGATGQTPGKSVMGLRVVVDGHRPPGYLRSIGRALVAALGMALLGGGYVPMLTDPEGRAVHDRLLRTRVIRDRTS